MGSVRDISHGSMSSPHPYSHLDQGLSGQHMLHLAGADAKGKGAKGSVGGGVGVSADNDRTGEGEPLEEVWKSINVTASETILILNHTSFNSFHTFQFHTYPHTCSGPMMWTIPWRLSSIP